MGFDKNKTMKSAERFLTQGRFSSAIKEYALIVENDPNDVSTLNILGDLHIKDDDKKSAISCYKSAAEYYHIHGFEKKAIAVYNKIHRLEPTAGDVSIKLAELYQSRGSLAEACRHYEEVANQYEKNGDNVEALGIWEQLAELSPRDTEIHLKIAEFYWKNNQKEEAAKAFIEGGTRLKESEKHEEAVAAFARALEVVPEDLVAIRGFVGSQVSLGYPEEGVKILADIHSHNPGNADVVFLLVDCYLDMEQPDEAEVVLVELISNEPKAYTKLLDIVNFHLKHDDLESSVRTLSMISEQLMVSQKPERLEDLLKEIVARDPEQVHALRLLTRYYGWHKNDAELRKSLEHLLDAANFSGAIDDERYAITQLLLLSPQEEKYISRLKKINGVDAEPESEPESAKSDKGDRVPTFESFNGLLNGNGAAQNLGNTAEEYTLDEPAEITLTEADLQTSPTEEAEDEANSDDGLNVKEQIENLRFYIAQGYVTIAEHTIKELDLEHGEREEFDEIRATLKDIRKNSPPEEMEFESAEKPPETFSEEESFVQEYVIENASGDQISGFETDTDTEQSSEPEEGVDADPEDTVESDEIKSDSLTDTEDVEDQELASEALADERMESNDASQEKEIEEEEVEASDEPVEEISSSIDEEYEIERAFREEEEKEEEEKKDRAQLESEQEALAEEKKESAVADSPENAKQELVTSDDKLEDSDSSKEVAEDEPQEAADEPENLEANSDESLVEDKDTSEPIELSKEDESPEVKARVEDPEPKSEPGKSASEDRVSSEEEINEAEAVSADAKEDDLVETEAKQAAVAQKDDSSLEQEAEKQRIDESNEEYETHYHHAVAYKEMGLHGDAVREFRSAVECVDANDGTERYLQCCTLIGHCFVEQNLPRKAIEWFDKAFNVKELNKVEKTALKYEIGNAYAQDCEYEKALPFFEEIHLADSDFRDVVERLEECRERSSLVHA